MIFTELRFLILFTLVYALHWALRTNSARKNLLLAASYVFYGAWDWRFLVLILFSTLIDYVVGSLLGRIVAPGPRKALLCTSLVLNLGLLGFFKYYNFFVDSAADFAALLGLEVSDFTLNIVLPVGISFYTFQTLSYTIDVYRRHMQPTRSFRDFALFVAFFPQLVAGPIVRAIDLLPQFAEKRRWDDVRFRAGLAIFFCGFVKKACVADNVAMAADLVFANPEAYSLADKWLGVLLYSVQAYCDFSGYSDMAIGLANLLGYELVKNFDFPLFAVSVTDFWRRWHISLMTWLRDYVYIPMGGNRAGSARTYFNLIGVFFLCGLWHGANWNYVVWGLFNGAFLIFERWARVARDFDPMRPGLHRRLYTHLVWSCGLVLFRAGSMPNALVYLRGMFVPGEATSSLHAGWWLALVLFGAVHWCMYRQVFQAFFARLPDWSMALVYGAGAALAVAFVATEYQPFIYFQF